jgi:hypothetical protein
VTPEAEVNWRRAPDLDGWRGFPVSGDLGQDGAEVYAFRTVLPDERCGACGRRGLRWRIDLALPSPFPSIGTVGAGCTREHALSGVPLSWADVGGYFASLAAAVRSRDPFTGWDARHADMRARQAARAARLAGWDRPGRRLALRLWTDDPQLDVQTMEAIVAAVLSEAIRLPSPERRSGDAVSPPYGGVR